MQTSAATAKCRFSKAAWFVLLYLAGLSSLTVLAMLLKGLLSGL